VLAAGPGALLAELERMRSVLPAAGAAERATAGATRAERTVPGSGSPAAVAPGTDGPDLKAWVRRVPGLRALERPHPEVLAALVRDEEVVGLLDEAGLVGRVVASPELAALVAAYPDLAEEWQSAPGQMEEFRFGTFLARGGLSWDLERDFAAYVDRLGGLDVSLHGDARGWVRGAVEPAWRAAEAAHRRSQEAEREAREERLSAFRAHLPDTWKPSGVVHYGNGLREESFTAAQQRVLAGLAGGAVEPRERVYGVNQALHAHLDGGSGGVSFAYVLGGDGWVDLLVYGLSTSRPGNGYRWHGNGGAPAAGALPLEAAEDAPQLTASQERVAELDRRRARSTASGSGRTTDAGRKPKPKSTRKGGGPARQGSGVRGAPPGPGQTVPGQSVPGPSALTVDQVRSSLIRSWPNVAGRDFTGRWDTPTLSAPPRTYRLLEESGGPAAPAPVGDPGTVPWPSAPAPYVVHAELAPGTRDRVHVLDAASGEARQLTFAEFAAVVASDPQLWGQDAAAPVLVLVPGALFRDLGLLRAVRDAVGRQVWGHTGRAVLFSDGPQGRLGLGVLRDVVRITGQWITLPRDAGRAAPGPPGRTVAVDGETFDDADVLLRPFADADGRMAGHWSVRQQTFTIGREGRLGVVASATESAHTVLLPDDRGMVRGSEPAVWSGLGPYLLVGHGQPGAVRLQVADGREVVFSGDQVGALLRRRRSFVELFPNRPVVALNCWAATPEPRQGVTFIQDLAHVSSRMVFGATSRVLLSSTTPSHPVGLVANPDGTWGTWRVALPNAQAAAQLDGLAASTGLLGPERPVTSDHRMLMLRIMRVTRDLQAPGAAVQPTVQSVAALARLHRDAASRAGAQAPAAFSKSFVERTVRAAHGWGAERAVTHEDIVHLLDRVVAERPATLEALVGFLRAAPPAPEDRPFQGAALGPDALDSGLVRPPVPVAPTAPVAFVDALLGSQPAELLETLEYLPAGQRRWLARDARFVEGLTSALTDGRLTRSDFARVAARLLVVVPDGVARPASARREAYALVTRVMRDEDVAATLLTGGAAVMVLPADTPLTALSGFQGSGSGFDELGRRYAQLRGATNGQLIAAVPEENLLGEVTTVAGAAPHMADGYSSVTHELAHLVHDALPEADRTLIDEVWRAKRALGGDEPWPDGIRRDLSGRDVDNYASTSPDEYFAQVTNTWLGTNTGKDEATGRPRENGAAYVHGNPRDGKLLTLLSRLYGENPGATHDAPVNPVAATAADNAVYEAFGEAMELTGQGERQVSGPPAGTAPLPTAAGDTTGGLRGAPPVNAPRRAYTDPDGLRAFLAHHAVPPTGVAFDEKSKTPGEGQQRHLRAYAQRLAHELRAWREQGDGTLPTVVVTGHGNGRNAQATGLQRAQAVADVLATALPREFRGAGPRWCGWNVRRSSRPSRRRKHRTPAPRTSWSGSRAGTSGSRGVPDIWRPCRVPGSGPTATGRIPPRPPHRSSRWTSADCARAVRGRSGTGRTAACCSGGSATAVGTRTRTSSATDSPRGARTSRRSTSTRAPTRPPSGSVRRVRRPHSTPNGAWTCAT
jgi:hypothetical protein